MDELTEVIILIGGLKRTIPVYSRDIAPAVIGITEACVRFSAVAQTRYKGSSVARGAGQVRIIAG